LISISLDDEDSAAPKKKTMPYVVSDLENLTYSFLYFELENLIQFDGYSFWALYTSGRRHRICKTINTKNSKQ